MVAATKVVPPQPPQPDCSPSPPAAPGARNSPMFTRGVSMRLRPSGAPGSAPIGGCYRLWATVDGEGQNLRLQGRT